MKRTAKVPTNGLLLFPVTKKFKSREESVPDNMSKNYSRPLSNMDFVKPSDTKNPTDPKNPTKYSLRRKNVDRMSKNQIEAIIKRNVDLEEENKNLKAEVQAVKGSASGQVEDGLPLVGNLDNLVPVADKEVQASIEPITIAEKATQVLIVQSTLDKEKQIAVDNVIPVEDKEVQASIESITIAEKGIQVSIVQSTLDKETQTPVAVVPEVVGKLVFDYLPWLNVVCEDKDFYSLEKQLVFGEKLQSDLIATTADKIKAPDEEIYMKYFLARIFSRQFFVDKVAFNARGTKVQFKNTVILRCFARSMVVKFGKSIVMEEAEEMIDMYQSKIQDFMMDFKILVKRNPNNWVR